MTPREVAEKIGKVPHMDAYTGEIITRHIHTFGLKRVIEMGTRHGASACFFAAAVKKLDGHVTTIDLDYTKDVTPNIEQLLEQCGLSNEVRIFREKYVEGGAWRLLKLIEAGEQFDLCYIDGSHLWRDVAADFIMMDRLLRPGGWMLFDDINWCLNKCEVRTGKWCDNWTDEMKARHMPRDVWRHLVQHHPGYFNFTEPYSNWGLCQKKP